MLAELTRLRLGALPDSMAEALDYITTRSEDNKQVVSIESRKKWWNLDKAGIPPSQPGLQSDCCPCMPRHAPRSATGAPFGRVYVKGCSRQAIRCCAG